MSKRTLNPEEKRKINLFSKLAFSGIWMLDNSIKFKHINLNPEITPVIYAIWHGWQYGLLGLPDRKRVHLLVSQSNDGEIISRTTNMLGFSTIRGSHKRGGTEALRAMLKTLKKGGSIAYTVDGPRGPIFSVKPGIIKIAQMSQIPILPLVPAVKHKFVAKSWDQYTVPHLFSKITSVYGDPIHVPKNLDDENIEKYRLNLETTLLSLKDKAESLI